MFCVRGPYRLASIHCAPGACKGGNRVNVPLEHKTVRMERLIGTETQQAVVEGSFALAANLPDIARIVRLAANPVVTDWNALEDEVVVHGAVDFVIVYAHDEEMQRTPRSAPRASYEGTEIEAEQGYHLDEGYGDTGFAETEFREALYRQRWRRGATFEAVLDVPGAHHDAIVDVQVEPLDIDVHLHTNGRGVDVEAVVSTTVRVSGYDTQDVVVKGKQFPAHIEVEEQTVQVENVYARGRTHISVEGQLPLSTEMPARTIVDIQGTVRIAGDADGGTSQDDKLTGSGFVEYRAVCTDQNGDLETFAWQEQTPFTFALDVPGVRAGQPFVIEANISSLDAAVATGGRGIEVFADINITARGAAVQSLTLISGLEGTEGREIHYRTDVFRLEQSIGKHACEQVAAGPLDLPQGHPPIERVLQTEAWARVEDVLVLGDKVIIEGQFDVAAMYVARTEGNPVHYVYWSRALPLEGEVPTPGAEPGMEADVKVDITEVDLDLLNRESVEAKVHFIAQARVTHPTERAVVVEAVEVPPVEMDPPTLTFIVVQADDTLWKLSHRYHTNVDDIMRANPWLTDADEPLPAGRKLCVPRRKPAPAPTV